MDKARPEEGMSVQVGYEDRSNRFIDKTDNIDHNPIQRDSSEEVVLLHEEQEQQECSDEDEPELDQGFGLGFLGLAALTLPSQDMVVPPLNYAMVRTRYFMSLSVVPISPRNRRCISLALGYRFTLLIICRALYGTATVR